MMNQGGSGLDPNIAKNYQGVDTSEGHVSVTTGQHLWSSSTGPVTASWNPYGTENSRKENGTSSTYGYHYGAHKVMTVTGDIHGGVNSASNASNSLGMGSASVTQSYANYPPYSNTTDPYAYNNTDYQSRYGYQQPASGSSTQQVGDYQNSGAPYQSSSSFHHTGYSGTYNNAGDHQTVAGYPNNNYGDQFNYWNGGSYASNQYMSYPSSDSISTQTSNLPASSVHYQQYGQYCYNASAPAVSSTPMTEHLLASSASTPTIPIQATSGGFPYPSNQPPPPGTTSWGRNSGSYWPPMQGPSNVMRSNLNASWEAPPVSYDHQMNQTSSNFQKPLDLNPVPPEKCEARQMTLYSQGPNLQPPTINQVPETIQSHLQTSTMSETRRVSKLQIPTNPRIASGLGLGMPKESTPTNAALKPAYISVPVPKPSNTLSSLDNDDAVMKGAFPSSLRGYVERIFARCTDDSQRAASQKVMKEVIAKASADGSLFTRNWDIEPLFPLPNSSLDGADQNNVQNSVTVSMLPKFKRSPSKRTKSRWEPVVEDKLVEKLASVSHVPPNGVSWDQFKAAERAVGTGSVKNEHKDNGWTGIKFVSSQQQTTSSKITHTPKKKPRFSDPTDMAQNGDASSDSDKEQGLTKYYASAIALANSPEEKKRREHRSKRFEKRQEINAEIKHYKPKVSGAGNIYTRRASAVLLAKTFEDSCSRAVEDIDWDALTVKGTCQEVEKRYLRLTSAPDPATVRPEEILEKALSMVQTSPKNYLYKCDQLKSIRQDLTVQRIQNELTVKVYETHARLALESGDLPEYNQCQSKLKSLYVDGIKGCHLEFSAYNLLGVILHSNNNRDLLSAMLRLSNEAKEDPAVKHALAVRSAVISGNYILFFRLYKDAPNLNTCLMDLYVEKMRFEAIKCISKSCRPTIPVAYIARNLGFSRVDQIEDIKELNRLDECEEWLKAHGAVLTVDNSGEVHLDTKASSSSLYMPEPEDAVAHGDASLAVNDFLTRASS